MYCSLCFDLCYHVFVSRGLYSTSAVESLVEPCAMVALHELSPTLQFYGGMGVSPNLIEVLLGYSMPECIGPVDPGLLVVVELQELLLVGMRDEDEVHNN